MSIEDALRDIKLSIHEIEVRLNEIEKDSHPPVFSKKQHKVIVERLEVCEAWIDNIDLIEKGDIN